MYMIQGNPASQPDFDSCHIFWIKYLCNVLKSASLHWKGILLWLLINIIFTQEDILGCRLSAKYIWDYCWVSQETPWKLPMPWSKLREQDKKPKHSKEYSELLRFYAKAHRVQEKLSKQPTKEAFYVFFVWFLNLHEDVNQSVF